MYYREKKRLWKWHRFKVLWLIPLGLFKCLEGEGVKARIERRQILVPVVITMFPMVWNAKNECFLYYKDINLSHSKAISIYNVHVWKSRLLSFFWDIWGPGLLYSLNYRQSIICSPLVFQHILKYQFKRSYSYLMAQSFPTNWNVCIVLTLGKNCYTIYKREDTLIYFIEGRHFSQQDDLKT